MNDEQKWLEAAAGLEQDILYLKAALVTATSHAVPGLKNGIEQLKLAVAVFKSNADAGTSWPSPDNLFCIDIHSCARAISGLRGQFKIAN
jgi:hypothetical protein